VSEAFTTADARIYLLARGWTKTGEHGHALARCDVFLFDRNGNGGDIMVPHDEHRLRHREWVQRVAGIEDRDAADVLADLTGDSSSERARLRADLARVTAERDEARRKASAEYERGKASRHISHAECNSRENTLRVQRDDALAALTTDCASEHKRALRLRHHKAVRVACAIGRLAAPRTRRGARGARLSERVRRVDQVEPLAVDGA
jgi:hypothetical protein